jgi:hypothetical protein
MHEKQAEVIGEVYLLLRDLVKRCHSFVDH